MTEWIEWHQDRSIEWCLTKILCRKNLAGTQIRTHDRLKIWTHLSRRATQPPTIVSVCFRNDRVLFEFHSNFRRLPLFVQKICISLRIRFLTAAKVKKSEGWLRMGHFLLHELFLLLFSPWVVPLMVRRRLNGSVYRLIKIQVFC